MPLWKVLILAIVQGLAELLPVSSSAHVVVAEKLLHLDPSAPAMTLLLVRVSVPWFRMPPPLAAPAVPPVIVTPEMLTLRHLDERGRVIHSFTKRPDGAVSL